MPNHENLISVDVVNSSPETSNAESSKPTNSNSLNEDTPSASVEKKKSNQLGSISAKPSVAAIKIP